MDSHMRKKLANAEPRRYILFWRILFRAHDVTITINEQDMIVAHVVKTGEIHAFSAQDHL